MKDLTRIYSIWDVSHYQWSPPVTNVTNLVTLLGEIYSVIVNVNNLSWPVAAYNIKWIYLLNAYDAKMLLPSECIWYHYPWPGELCDKYFHYYITFNPCGYFINSQLTKVSSELMKLPHDMISFSNIFCFSFHSNLTTGCLPIEPENNNIQRWFGGHRSERVSLTLYCIWRQNVPTFWMHMTP